METIHEVSALLSAAAVMFIYRMTLEGMLKAQRGIHKRTLFKA